MVQYNGCPSLKSERLKRYVKEGKWTMKLGTSKKKRDVTVQCVASASRGWGLGLCSVCNIIMFPSSEGQFGHSRKGQRQTQTTRDTLGRRAKFEDRFHLILPLLF